MFPMSDQELIAYTNTVFVDAPHILLPADLEGINPTALDAAEAAMGAEPNPEELPRGWWRTNPERTKYDGVAESVAVIRDVLAKDRFDVRCSDV